MGRNRARGFAAAALSAVGMLSGAGSALATNTAGTLDPTWSVGSYGAGYAVFNPGNSRVHPRTIRLLPDQRMIVSADPVTLGRLGTAGLASLPFGFLGGTVISGGCNSSQWPTDIAIQSDGKILTACTNGSNDALVARFTASNGAADTTFGAAATGVVTTDVSSRTNYGHGVAVTPDGKIVVVGYAYNSTITAADLTLMRYTAAGALDATFGTGGIVVATLSGRPWTHAGRVAVQGDGKIVVAGDGFPAASSVGEWMVARYNTDGTLDTTFGGGTGAAFLNWGTGGGSVRALALQGDGKIVLTGNFQLGSGAQAIGLARYNSDGTLDSSFGGGLSNTIGPGTRITSLDLGESPNGLALQYDGKIVVAGQTTTGPFSKVNGLVLRYTADGTLDTTFGTGGYITASTGPYNAQETAYGVDVQADGKILVAFDAYADGLVMRLLGDTPEVLTLSFAGTGTGQVTSTPGGINCTANCTGNFALGLPLLLSATATNGAQFAGWTGCDSVNGSNQCVVSINGARAVTAQFDSFGVAAATIGIASSANPSISGQSVTLTATLSGGSGTPTGTATFKDNGTAIGGCSALAIASGTAQCVTSSLSLGSHPITVAYSGDTVYAPATSAPFDQTVNVQKADPNVSLGATPNPAVVAHIVTLTGSVTGSAGTPTGTLAFADGGAAIAGCSAVALVSGSASCGWTVAAAGTHAVTAAYSGDGAYNAATSSSVNEVAVRDRNVDRTDVNGDGRSDLVWRNNQTGFVYRMLMNGMAITASAGIYQEPNTAWQVVSDADFDGNGAADLLWRNTATGQVWLMPMDTNGNPAPGAMVYTEPNAAWKIVQAPDLDGDGKADLVWWNSSTGQVYAMLMNGAAIGTQGMVYREPNTDWRIVAAGDFAGSGKSNQLLWWNATTGQVYLMTIGVSGGHFTQAGAMIYQEPNTAWKIVLAADFDGDGRTDILWRNDSTGQVHMQLMNGTSIASQGIVYQEPNTAWKIVTAGDFDGDGRADLLWRNDSTGQVYMMAMNGLAIGTHDIVYVEPNPAWRLLGAREYAVQNGLVTP